MLVKVVREDEVPTDLLGLKAVPAAPSPLLNPAWKPLHCTSLPALAQAHKITSGKIQLKAELGTQQAECVHLSPVKT